MEAEGWDLDPWTKPEAVAKPTGHERPEQALARAALVEHYVNRLREDPCVRRAAAHPGLRHTLTWAADELEHVARTVDPAFEADSRYELEQVLEEIREKLALLVAEPVKVAG